jgi:hypothetical protein
VLIDQVQSRDVEMVSEPWPPLGPNDAGALVATTWHLSDVGAVSDVLVLLHAAVAHMAAASAITTL